MTSALIALPDATDRANTLLATFQRTLADYNRVSPFHFLAATWEIAAAGLLIMVGGAVVVFISDEAATSEDRMRHAAVA